MEAEKLPSDLSVWPKIGQDVGEVFANYQGPRGNRSSSGAGLGPVKERVVFVSICDHTELL